MEKLSYRFVLYLVHWVDFAIHSFRSIFLELDSMVPGSFWWESLRFLFAEYFGELLAFRWDLHLLHILLCFGCKFSRSCGSQLSVVLLGSCDYWVSSGSEGIYRLEDDG